MSQRRMTSQICPAFVRSRFLVYKHLIQAVRPVPPTFFLHVKRKRTFHSGNIQYHPTPLPPQPPTTMATMTSENQVEASDEDEDDTVITEATHWACDGRTYREQLISQPFGISVMDWSANPNPRIGGSLTQLEILRRCRFCGLQKLVSAGRDGQTRHGVQ